MVGNGCLRRSEKAVWRNIGGEVVIVEQDGITIRVLNRVASLIWCLADGASSLHDMAGEISRRFEVAPPQALTDAHEFCQVLIQEGLLTRGDALERSS